MWCYTGVAHAGRDRIERRHRVASLIRVEANDEDCRLARCSGQVEGQLHQLRSGWGGYSDVEGRGYGAFRSSCWWGQFFFRSFSSFEGIRQVDSTVCWDFCCQCLEKLFDVAPGCSLKNPLACWVSPPESGSLDLRSWYAGQLTKKCHSCSMKGSRRGGVWGHPCEEAFCFVVYLSVSIPRKWALAEFVILQL